MDMMTKNPHFRGKKSKRQSRGAWTFIPVFQDGRLLLVYSMGRLGSYPELAAVLQLGVGETVVVGFDVGGNAVEVTAVV